MQKSEIHIRNSTFILAVEAINSILEKNSHFS